MKKGIVIHTKDLRIYDNRTIKKAYDECQEVLHIFILDSNQLQKKRDSVFDLNTNAIQFMYESLLDLNEQLKDKESQLVILNNTFENSLDFLKDQFEFESIFISKDYSPNAFRREESLISWSKNNNVEIEFVEEHLLLDSTNLYLKPADKNPYTVFTPMYKNALKHKVPYPLSYEFDSISKSINQKLVNETNKSFDFLKSLFRVNENLAINGGRKVALDIISNMKKYNYHELRDFPYLDKTTKLSAHHKFGTISMRESYYFLEEVFKEEAEALQRELYWHDFYILIAKHFPHVFTSSFQKQYQDIKWIDDSQDENFKKWCDGQTGYPIIDAGMRELNTTGYMHNRVRMIVASFLTKDLHIHWLLGEKYFASKLTDYDSSVNNGSWQWAASTGCDAQPYFRIFNPWLQQKRFDKECLYIKKWIPELNGCTPQIIHNLESQRPLFSKIEYVKPIVDHKKQKEIALNLFKK